jgi:hypothetical protein
MAGQLTVDQLRASTGVLATQNGMTGIAKAWVKFVGSTATVSSSFNVSSITRSSAGIYVINFTTAMANTNYACIGNAGTDGTYAAYCVLPFSAYTTVTAGTTSAVTITTFVAAVGSTDSPNISVAIFGA